jgi:hypothetical protein
MEMTQNTTRSTQTIRLQAQALRDLHAEHCAAIRGGADCLGQNAKPKHFKGFIKGSNFRTLETAASYCNDFAHALQVLRFEYMNAGAQIHPNGSRAYAIAFDVTAPTIELLNSKG